jgi:hypothetical protein
MKNACRILLFLCLFPSLPLDAQDRGVEIRSTEKDLVVTEPGKIITAVFKVTNTGTEKQEFVLKPGLPHAWSLITRPFPFVLDTGRSDLQLVSFIVPQAALADKYPVTVSVQGTASPNLMDSLQAFVVVLPVTRLSVRVLDAPRFAVAGEEYLVSFVVANEGNVSHEVSLRFESTQGYPLFSDAGAITLGPRESRKVNVAVRTAGHITETVRSMLALHAEVSDNTGVKEACDSVVDVIPRAAGGEGIFHTLPATIGLQYVGDYAGEGMDAGFQTVVSGSGTLDEGGAEKVSFLFRGPDLFGRSGTGPKTFASHDEYRVNLLTEGYSLMAGDGTYTLSPLTSASFFGRGGGGSLNLSGFQLGSYHAKSRWFDAPESQTAFFARCALQDGIRFGLNYLYREEQNATMGMGSFESWIRPMEGVDVNFEYGCGGNGRDDAVAVSSAGMAGQMACYTTYIRAGPDYPGGYNDMDFFSTSISLPVLTGLMFSTGFRQEIKNLDLDLSKKTATLERFYQTGLNFLPGTGASLGFDLMMREYQDRFPDPSFDYTEYTGKVSVSQSFQFLNFLASAESGREYDRIGDGLSTVERYTLSASLRPEPNQSCGTYAFYDKDRDEQGKLVECLTLGLSGEYHTEGGFSLAVGYETRESVSGGGGDRSMYTALMSCTLFKTNRIFLQGRYIVNRDQGQEDQGAVAVAYTIPFGLPVSRKKSVGSVKGYLYDEETKKTLGNVILRLNGEITITDEDGEFSFGAVKPGACYLEVDSSRVGLDKIPAQKTPIQVMVEGGESSFVKVGVIRAASVRGRVVAERAGPRAGAVEANDGSYAVQGNGKGDAPGEQRKECPGEAYGLGNILVQLKGDTQTLNRVTDREGRFEFGELCPGKWTLTIDEETLPEYHTLKGGSQSFDLAPGDHRETTLEVGQVKRRILIIEEKEIGIQKGPAKSVRP